MRLFLLILMITLTNHSISQNISCTIWQLKVRQDGQYDTLLHSRVLLNANGIKLGESNFDGELIDTTTWIYQNRLLSKIVKMEGNDVTSTSFSWNRQKKQTEEVVEFNGKTRSKTLYFYQDTNLIQIRRFEIEGNSNRLASNELNRYDLYGRLSSTKVVNGVDTVIDEFYEYTLDTIRVFSRHPNNQLKLVRILSHSGQIKEEILYNDGKPWYKTLFIYSGSKLMAKQIRNLRGSLVEDEIYDYYENDLIRKEVNDYGQFSKEIEIYHPADKRLLMTQSFLEGKLTTMYVYKYSLVPAR